jgi:hypothetical protein
MIEDYTEGTGTAVVGGTEQRTSRSLVALLWPIALSGSCSLSSPSGWATLGC